MSKKVHSCATAQGAARLPIAVVIITTPKALVVDDSPEVARVIHRMLVQVLARHGKWEVRYTTDPQQGLKAIAWDEHIRMVFVDSVMPLLNGDDLIEAALAQRPDLRGRIVVCSGLWFEEHREKRLFEELGCERLDKPFRLEALAEVVGRVAALP